MGDSAQEAEISADSGERLKKIQDMLEENEALRKKKTTTSLVGIVVLLALLGIFIYRLYGQGQAVVEQSPAIAKEVWTQSQPALESEFAALRTDLKEQAIPELTEAMKVAMEREMPKFETEAREMGSRLYTYSRQTVEAQLIEALGRSLLTTEEELKAVFPQVSAAELEQSLEASGDLFVERAYEVVELHVSRVSASLDGLKASVKKVADTKGAEELSRERLDWAEEEVITALTDLVVYEFKPAMGEEPAAPAGKGGEK